jgi:hypothetical protein
MSAEPIAVRLVLELLQRRTRTARKRGPRA